MTSFLRRFGHVVTGVISGFDRLRFRGTLRSLAYTGGMSGFLADIGVLLKDFGGFVERVTAEVRGASQRIAEKSGRPLIYLESSSVRKDELARAIAERDGISRGLVCILSCVEPCVSYEIYRNKRTKRLELTPRHRKCLHHYHYFIDSMFGWSSVRLQTWFPFTVHLCLNGREWLARQMDARRIGYLQKRNCFTWIDDPPAAQKLLDHQLTIDWPKHADRLLHRAHPRYRQWIKAWPIGNYYWTVEQSEWATDLMFESPTSLAEVYPDLLSHAVTLFQSEDVMRFLGHKLPAHGGIHGRFAGEIVSDLKRRPEGIRVKHRVGNNSIKMYDKHGQVLRVETTINDPSPWKVYRKAEGNPASKKKWRSLRKGVADLARRAKVSGQGNDRYLQALASADGETPLGVLVERITNPRTYKGKRVRGLRPFSPDDRALIEAIGRPEFVLHGFRNRDLRPLLFGSTSCSANRRRQSAAVTRKLRLLRAHGLIKKIPRTHRYRLTQKGQILTTALLAALKTSTEQLLDAA